MKIKTKYILIAILTLSSLRYVAQQNSLFNTYVFDPFQLNIAYAANSCTEATANYRTQWIGMKDAPTLFQINGHMALGNSNGIGLRLISQQMGLLNNAQVTLGYAYKFRVSKTAHVFLGLGAGITQNVFNAQRAVVVDAANDATLNSGRQKATGFDSEFGVMYVGQKLKAGFSVLHLYNSNPTFVAGDYKLLPQANINVSYIFNQGKKVEIEPWLVDRYTVKGTNIIEGILNVHFLKILTVGAGYRSNYGVIGILGVKAGSLKIAYSFDYGTSANATYLGSSHQILLGFTLCKAPKVTPPKSEPESTPVITPTVATEPAKEEKKEEVVVQETPKEEIKQEPKIEIVALSTEDIIAKMNNIAEKVVFGLGKSTLDQTTLLNLDAIAKLMSNNPSIKINIIGHTCNIGDAEGNKALSQQRANYVKAQLINRGANANNINNTIGVGLDKELYANDPATQSKNRTIRFEVAKS